MFRFFVALLIALSIPVVYVHAQFSSADPLSITISPEYPRPYEVVTVTPNSTLIDLSATTRKYSVNGKNVSVDAGAQSIPVTMGGPGEKTTISISAVFGGKTYRKDLVIRPADVALVVEPVSTAHPFYKGALGLAPEGRVRLIAIPDLRTSASVRSDPSALSYTWRFGNKILQGESGIGKNVLTASGPMRYRSAQISVVVATPDSAVVARAQTLLEPVDPLIRVYPSSPLLGIDFDHSLIGSYVLSGSEESFRGVAYFFAGDPTLAWTVSGQGSGADKDVTVRTTGSGSGTASLSLTARLAQTHQSVTNSLNVVFGTQKNTNVFGF